MEASIPRRFLAVIEPIGGSVFFSPEAHEEYAALGVTDPWGAYVGSRAAAMGRVATEVVVATFYNFNPELVRRSVDWNKASPEDMVAARFRGARRTLERLLATDDGAVPDVTRLAGLLEEAASGARPDGRPLYAAHAGLPAPEHPLERLWHAATMLREHRGDGHIALLISHRLAGIDALCLNAGYLKADRATYFFTRQWPDAAIDAATAALASRGLLTPEGALTDAGWKFREMIERETDRTAAEPYEALGPERCEEALALAAPLRERIVSRRGIPSTAARMGQPPEKEAAGTGSKQSS